MSVQPSTFKPTFWGPPDSSPHTSKRPFLDAEGDEMQQKRPQVPSATSPSHTPQQSPFEGHALMATACSPEPISSLPR